MDHGGPSKHDPEKRSAVADAGQERFFRKDQPKQKGPHRIGGAE
jgi:hypothetical protein